MPSGKDQTKTSGEGHNRQKRHSKGVTFAPDALSHDAGGSSVTVRQEHVSITDALGRLSFAEEDGGTQSLSILMGLLKCGYRYEVTVSLPDNAKNEIEAGNLLLRVAKDALDPDLHAEVWTADEDGSGRDDDRRCVGYVRITLSARRPGPYQSQFLLELVPLAKVTATTADPPSIRPTSHDAITSKAPSSSRRRLISVRVNATLMGKDEGTPKIKSDVRCCGRLIGYDSDEETEWQGFD